MKERKSESCRSCTHNKENVIRQGSICWECKNDATIYDRYPYWEMDDTIIDYEKYLLDEENEEVKY
jgi:hypothetical protein